MYKFGGRQTRSSVVGLFHYVLRDPSSSQLTKNVVSFLMVKDGSHHICFPDNRVEEERGKEVPKLFFKKFLGASLVAQWLRICLSMQGTRVRALVWEDPTCRRAARPVSHDYWACASGACAPQWKKPRQWEARAPRWRVAPACRNWRKPSHRNEDPTHPKINK